MKRILFLVAMMSLLAVTSIYAQSPVQGDAIELSLVPTGYYGLGRNHGVLFNKINSISPRYWDKWGITIKIRF